MDKMQNLNEMANVVFGTNNFDGLLSKGVQTFFLNGENFFLAEVWTGVHSGGNGKTWMKASILHWGYEVETPYRLVQTEDGWRKAVWDDHFEAWMPDWNTPVEVDEDEDI